ncbi:MAG: hypothetical protein WCA38_18145 [Candidatus Acidiferrales bacterium]
MAITDTDERNRVLVHMNGLEQQVRRPANIFETSRKETGISVLAHELMHRNERRGEISKCVRETEAEAVAYVVSQAIGLETISAARDYIQL